MLTRRCSMPTRALSPWLAVLVCTTLSATEIPTISDPEVRACIDKAMPEQSLKQKLILRALDDDGIKNESAGDVYWRREIQGSSRAVIRLSEPASRKGLAVLAIEREGKEPDLYLYVPDLARTRRVTGKQIATSMMGTDFSYEEFSYLQSIAGNSETERIEDQDLDGHAAYVLQTTPGDETAIYGRILIFVDQEQCIPVQTQFFATGGDLHKEMIATRAEIKQITNRYVPHHIVMHDRAKETRTELIVTDVEIDIEIGDSVFNPKSLGTAF